MDSYEHVVKQFELVRQQNDADANKFWDSLSYDDKCDAFHAVVQRIVEGEIAQSRSYRGMLYDIFEFEEDMYVRAMECGFMQLHNSIMTKEQKQKAKDERLTFVRK